MGRALFQSGVVLCFGPLIVGIAMVKGLYRGGRYLCTNWLRMVTAILWALTLNALMAALAWT